MYTVVVTLEIQFSYDKKNACLFLTAIKQPFKCVCHKLNSLVLQVAECQFVSSATSLQRCPMLVLVLGCCNVNATLFE